MTDRIGLDFLPLIQVLSALWVPDTGKVLEDVLRL